MTYMKLLSILLSLFISESLFAQIPFKIISQPEYRIVKEKMYQSKGFDIPEVLNDSTADLMNETRYIYSGNKLVLKKNSWIDIHDTMNVLHLDSMSDSIVYYSADSVSIFRKYAGKHHASEKKLTNYILLLNEILTKGKYKLSINDVTYTFSVDNGFIKKIKEQTLEDWHTANYLYKNNILRERKNKGKYKFDSKDTFTYHNSNHYEISSSGGNVWCCSFHYYFNDEGYLIQYASESDTNATIVVYEYEKAKGNAGLLYNNIDNITGMRPFIY